MASEIELKKDQEAFTEKQLAVLHENLGVDKATPAELAMFFDQCQRTGLNPWARQIYMIGRWDYTANRNKYQVQVSIDGARLVAERTGEYEGQTAPQWCGTDGIWRDVWLEPTPPAAARVGVWRKGFREPAYGVARLASYAQTNKKGKLTMTWTKMPDVMLAKCAESLALRKAFPMELSGLYTSEEMQQMDNPESAEAETPASETEQEYVEAEIIDDRDWLKEINEAGTIEQLRAIWGEAKTAGAFNSQPALADIFTTKADELKAVA